MPSRTVRFIAMVSTGGMLVCGPAAFEAAARHSNVAEIEALHNAGIKTFRTNARSLKIAVDYPASWRTTAGTQPEDLVTFHSPSDKSTCALRIWDAKDTADVSSTAFFKILEDSISATGLSLIITELFYDDGVPVRRAYYNRSTNYGMDRTERMVSYSRIVDGNVIGLVCGVRDLTVPAIDEYFDGYVSMYQFMSDSMNVTR